MRGEIGFVWQMSKEIEEFGNLGIGGSRDLKNIYGITIQKRMIEGLGIKELWITKVLRNP